MCVCSNTTTLLSVSSLFAAIGHCLSRLCFNIMFRKKERERKERNNSNARQRARRQFSLVYHSIELHTTLFLSARGEKHLSQHQKRLFHIIHEQSLKRHRWGERRKNKRNTPHAHRHRSPVMYHQQQGGREGGGNKEQPM